MQRYFNIHFRGLNLTGTNAAMCYITSTGQRGITVALDGRPYLRGTSARRAQRTTSCGRCPARARSVR